MPQSVLYLPRDEGGQGLIHLSSSGATFRFQFLQRFLFGPADLVWRPLACIILSQLGGLGLDRSLFLMDLKQVNFSELPDFYRGLFKCWSLLEKERLGQHSSVYWLLQEPVISGTRFSAFCQVGATMLRWFCVSKVVTLGHVVQLAGGNMDNAAPLASHLEVKSICVITLLLNKWREALTNSEQTLLHQYCNGSIKMMFSLQ